MTDKRPPRKYSFSGERCACGIYEECEEAWCGVDIYAIEAARSRLGAVLMQLGINPWPFLGWAPIRMATVIRAASKDAWAAWLRKFPGQDQEYLASLTNGSHDDVPSRMFGARDAWTGESVGLMEKGG